MEETLVVDFTIITPVYNGAEWIEETIDSVLKVCDGYSFEYIVVNDGSTDATLDKISKFDPKVKLVNQVNQGEAAAVNNGLSTATGTYVLIVSADDPMRSPQLLDEAKKILDLNKSVVCAYPDWSVINSSSIVVRDVTVAEFSESRLIGEFNCIVGPGGIFRREEALNIGGRNIAYRFTSDYEFWLRLSQLGTFERIPGFLAFWREHEASTSISQRGLAMANERIEVMTRFIGSSPQIPRKIQKMALGNAYFNAALLIYFDKKVPAKKFLFRALTIYPQGIKRFNLKILLFIVMFPLSPKVHSILMKLRFYRGKRLNA